MTINVNIRSNDPQFAGNIAIPHKKGVQIKGDANSSDAIEQSSATYQEDRVPAIDAPELAQIFNNLSSISLKSTLVTPKGKFESFLSLSMANLSKAQLNLLQQANPNITTPQQAQKFLLFAWTHPGSIVDPQVRELLEQMIDQAKQETMGELGLASDWTPPSPNTKKADQKMAATQDKIFLQLANQLAQTPQEVNVMTAAYYHPELTEELSPELQQLLSECESAAASETQEEFALPPGFSPPKDSEGFDLKMKAGFFDKFVELLEHAATDNELTDSEKAQLKTLFSDPKANVPARVKLLSLFKNLFKEAKQQMLHQFNLPANFKFGSFKELFQGMLAGQYVAEFEEKVNNQTDPPLTPEQKQFLLATGGNFGTNLPPELKALFDKIKGETLSEIQERYGLPKDWAPKLKTQDLKTKTEKKEGGSKSENTGEKAEIEEFSMDGMREVHASSEGINLNQIFQPFTPDAALQKQVINHYVEYTNHLNNFVKSFLNLNESMGAGDSLLAVHLALDNLRSSIYATQSADSQLAVKNALMQKEVTQMKILKMKQQIADIEKQESEHPKECFIYKIIDIINPIVPVLNTIVEDVMKTVFWALDLLLGGIIGTIFQAAGSEPPGEDPLETFGAVNEQTAAAIDGALSIAIAVLMTVVEIVISCIFMQPELVALETAEITETVAQDAAMIAVRVAVTAAREAVEEAVKETTEEVVTRAAETAVKDAVEEGVKDTTEEVAKNTVKVSEKEIQKYVETQVREAVQNRIDEEVKESVIKGTEKASEDLVKRISRREVKKALDEFEKKLAEDGKTLVVERTLVDDVKEGYTEALERGAEILQKMKVLVGRAKEEDDEVLQAFVESAKEEAAKHTLTGNFLCKIQYLMQLQGLVGDVCQSAQGFMEYFLKTKQANTELAIAELQAEIETLDTDLQILQKFMKILQTSLASCASWVNEVNKQESQFYQKMQIHYIAA